MSAPGVRRWSASEFEAQRAAWQDLLARSDADALFMSWDWVSAWWRHHAAVLEAELYLLAVYSPSGELLGLAPFYRHRGVHRGVFGVRRLELLGAAWRDTQAVFSEYLDIIAARESRAAVHASLAEWLRSSAEWDELLVCNTREHSLAAELAEACGEFTHLRPAESLTGWSIALPESFAAFTAQLSSNTRRKVLHQRDKLGGAYREVHDPAQRQAAFARLEGCVARRWGRPSTVDARSRFHAELVASWPTDRVRLSELHVGSRVVSTMLNLRVGATEYYLLSGFDADAAQGVSPGYLHLGYAIESACHAGLKRFDFLAGGGLHRDYKSDFAAVGTTLVSRQAIRKPLLRTLFGILDRLRGR
jgi:CelD/BcsL family acetyltransferase involved in cellulose biosynthesis